MVLIQINSILIELTVPILFFNFINCFRLFLLLRQFVQLPSHWVSREELINKLSPFPLVDIVVQLQIWSNLSAILLLDPFGVYISPHFLGELIVSTPLVTCGGRNYTLNGVFFVQTILVNRHFHRREMWVVSLKSSSSVEFENKNTFWIHFFGGAYEVQSFILTRDIRFTFFTFTTIFVELTLFL